MRVTLPWPKDKLNQDNFDDIEYEYDDGSGVVQRIFSKESALAAMLLSDAIFLNSNWWEEGWPEDARKTVAICVNTNDIFAWGSADAETITHKEIEEVYRYWVKDPGFGTAIWAIIRNKEMPQKPVEDAIRKAGIWDLDKLRVEHCLRANHYDGISRVITEHKDNPNINDLCNEWRVANGYERR